MQLVRRRITEAVERWEQECTWVTPGGRTPKERAWECYRDWVLEEKAMRKQEEKEALVTPRDVSNLVNDDEGFHWVMASRSPGLSESYRITVAAAFVPKPKKPVRSATKPSRPRTPRPLPGKR